MNHKGQTLVLFIFLIPLFVMILALIVDIGLITNANIKYESIAKESLKVIKSKSLEAGQNYLEKNGLTKDNYEIITKNNEIEVRINNKVDSIFGTIINIKEYEINIVEKGEVWWERKTVKQLASFL